MSVLLYSILIILISIENRFVKGAELIDNRLPDHNIGCGSTFRGRVVGGKSVRAEQHPWIVSLFIIDSTNNDAKLCGGTIVDPKWIITAAHCVSHEFSYIKITIGSNIFNSDLNQTGVLIMNATKIDVCFTQNFRKLKNRTKNEQF